MGWLTSDGGGEWTPAWEAGCRPAPPPAPRQEGRDLLTKKAAEAATVAEEKRKAAEAAFFAKARSLDGAKVRAGIEAWVTVTPDEIYAAPTNPNMLGFVVWSRQKTWGQEAGWNTTFLSGTGQATMVAAIRRHLEF